MKGYFIGNVAFVRSCMTGYWLKTHVSVLYVDCPVCGAAAGVACESVRKHRMSEVHVKRRKAYEGYLRKNLTIGQTGYVERGYVGGTP